MPKRAAKLANSAATTVGVRWSELLPEMWAEIWKWVLCDKVGNVTVPGLVYECHNWRLVCKQFRTLSQTTPTPYDATIWFSGVNQPPCSRGLAYIAEERRCRLLRHARSGQVFFVTCMPDADHPGYQQTLKKWSLPDLVACLGGHNADFKTRLRDLGDLLSLSARSRAAHRVRNFPAVDEVPVIVDDRGATIETIFQEAPNTPMHRRGFTSRDYVTSMVETTETTTRSLGAAATTERVHRRSAGLAFCATYFDSQSTHTVEACEDVPATTDDGVEHAVCIRGACVFPQTERTRSSSRAGCTTTPTLPSATAGSSACSITAWRGARCRVLVSVAVGRSSGEMVQRVMGARRCASTSAPSARRRGSCASWAALAAKKARKRASTSLVVYGGAPAGAGADHRHFAAQAQGGARGRRRSSPSTRASTR